MPGSLGAEPPLWLASPGGVSPASGTGTPRQLLWGWREPEPLSCRGPLPLVSHPPCGSLHEPWGPLSSGGGAPVPPAGQQASPPLPSLPGGSPHKSRGCVPNSPKDALNSPSLQLAPGSCSSTSMQLESKTSASSSGQRPLSGFRILLGGSPLPSSGGGAGEGVVPIH